MPSGVTRNTHNASTFKPYDPGALNGDLSPTTIRPEVNTSSSSKKGCGIVGKILLVVVAVAVTVITQEYSGTLASAILGTGGAAAGTTAAVATSAVGAAIAGAAGSIASQAVGVLTGIQEKFSWSGVALAAISAGVGGGGLNVGGFASGLTNSAFINGAIGGAAVNIASQGIGVATGLQDSFSWAGVAAAGVGAGAGSEIGNRFGTGFGGQLARSGASAIANAATRSAIEGSNFGDNIVAAIPDVIGGALGNAAGGALVSRLNNFVNSDPVVTGQGVNENGVSYTQYSDGSTKYGTVIIEDTRSVGQITGYDIDAMLANQAAWGQVYAGQRAATYASLGNISYTNGFFGRVNDQSFDVKLAVDHYQSKANRSALMAAQAQYRDNARGWLTSPDYINSGQSLAWDIYNYGGAATRLIGAAQAAFGVGEAFVGGAAVLAGVATSPTGIGAVAGIGGGGLLFANGVDNLQAGVRTALTGEFQQTGLNYVLTDVAGIDPTAAAFIEIGAGLGAGAAAVKLGNAAVANTRLQFNGLVDFGASYPASDYAGFGAVNIKQVNINKINGDLFEAHVIETVLPKTQNTIRPQVTIKSNGPSSLSVRLDAVGFDNSTNAIALSDMKASLTAPHTPNQTIVYPELAIHGGTVRGAGKYPFVGGTSIPPTTVNIIRKKS